MKCLIVSTFERSGGAARSAQRLFHQLRNAGVDCRMLVQYRQSNDPQVITPKGWFKGWIGALRPYCDGFLLLCYRLRYSPPWSLAWLPGNIDRELSDFSPDIIHLHGVGHGFLSIQAIMRLNAPLVWTLHDSWAFTGGCHLPGDCTGYVICCGRCPQLNMIHEHDLSRWGWQRKANNWPQLNVNFVAPSRWLAECARASALLGNATIDVIGNGIDTELFSPGDRTVARTDLGIPLEGTVLLFGASEFTRDKNKGFDILKSALSMLSKAIQQEKIILVLFGDQSFQEKEMYGIQVYSFAQITTDEKLVTLYRAADVFVLPSLQENLPNTVMEAMACGIPCVAFSVGGVGELVTHGDNGYLAKKINSDELAMGISWMLSDEDRRVKLGRQARKKIELNFNLSNNSESYISLYQRLLGAHNPKIS